MLTNEEVGEECLRIIGRSYLSSGPGSGPALTFVPKVPKSLAGHACAWRGQSECLHMPGALWGTRWRRAAQGGEPVELPSSSQQPRGSAGTRERKNGPGDAVFKPIKYGVARQQARCPPSVLGQRHTICGPGAPEVGEGKERRERGERGWPPRPPPTVSPGPSWAQAPAHPPSKLSAR